MRQTLSDIVTYTSSEFMSTDTTTEMITVTCVICVMVTSPWVTGRNSMFFESTER